MIKKSSRIQYEYEGQKRNIKEIYAKNKKRRGRSKYLLSVDVMVGKENPIPVQKSYASGTSQTLKIGLLLSAQIQLCQKKRSSVSMENAGILCRYLKNADILPQTQNVQAYDEFIIGINWRHSIISIA